MSKSIAKSSLIQLPSGAAVHPCRLIHRDGTLMWKHALMYNNKYLGSPNTTEIEFNIINTALRLEELNVWASKDFEVWESLVPSYWFDESNPQHNDGLACYFNHTMISPNDLYLILIKHINNEELLEERANYLFFKRF
tara:strand:- start:431 stop:844 length:414 start_codon:yes stop_codon:yes gene_type:complete